MKTHSAKLSVLFLLLVVFLTGCNDDENQITSTNQLVAAAGTDTTVVLYSQARLDGSASHDRGNKPFTYQWSVKSTPAGSTAVLSTPSSSKTQLTTDRPGIYVIQLTIRQGSWSDDDDVVVTVASGDPGDPETVLLNENIYSNTTLTDIFEDPSQPDYRVTTDIEVRSDLIIGPGVVIAFEENTGLQIIEGSIQAVGTPALPIMFKGLVDNPGYWKGILIHTNSDLNEFRHVTVRQAGSSAFTESGTRANVALAGSDVSGASLKITFTHFSESGSYGLFVQGMSSLGAFSNNILHDNGGAAAFIPVNELHHVDNTSTTVNNGYNGIETGGTIAASSSRTWHPLMDGSYKAIDDIVIASGVVVDPGTTFQMNSGITIRTEGNGYLDARGTHDATIFFTSSASGVYWNGIFFNSQNQNNKLTFCIVEYAGNALIADADHPANVFVGHGGLATIENSLIRNGLGYGVVTKAVAHVNQNIRTVNTFDNLQGVVFPLTLNNPDQPSLTGVWMDQWSFGKRVTMPVDNFYDRASGTWFDGASNPWAMTNAGFGMRIEENGTFVWAIAEPSPMVGCESWSAEYMTGTTYITPTTLHLDLSYWRSKFINSCDASQNVDTEVTPTDFPFTYVIEKIIDSRNNEPWWRLKINNPDNTSFYMYRKI